MTDFLKLALGAALFGLAAWALVAVPPLVLEPAPLPARVAGGSGR